jgi:hypothetical protein
MPAVLAPQPATITIQDQTPAGKILHELFLKFSTHRISAAELIRERVRQEVEAYNNRSEEALLRHSLVIPTARGDIVLDPHGKKHKPADAETQIAIALKAFEQNGFFILADNRQLETLDETVYLHDGLIVNFIKLTPLVGG